MHPILSSKEALKNLQELKDEIETMITATLEDIKHQKDKE